MRQSTSLGVLTFSFSSEVPVCGRRQDEIVANTLRVAKLDIAGERQLCLIRNISQAGLRARVYQPFEIGSKATVELKTENRIAGTVAWAQSDHIGIRFDAPIDVEAALSSETLEANGFRSRLPRIECAGAVTLRSGPSLLRCEAVDISQGGLKVRSHHTVPEGDVVVVVAGLYPIAGSVRWSKEDFIGIAFKELIPFERLLEWTRSCAR